MGKFLVAIAFLCGGTLAGAESILPTADGTTWKYQMTQEFGQGVRPTAGQNAKVDPDGKVRLPVVISIHGTEEIDGIATHKFEMRREGAVQAVQFIEVNDRGAFELARGNGKGDKVQYDHPQKMLSFPLKAGEKWENKAEVGGKKIDETYEVIGQESVEVPAGKFSAYHLRMVGIQPFRSVVDRWYAPKVGEIKDVTDIVGADGSMRTRISLELTALPTGAGNSPADVAGAAQSFSVVLAGKEGGEITSAFDTDVPKIYARWQGEHLEKGDKIRAVWIAEDVGEVAPKNYAIDEASTTANGPRASGTFTLSKPDKGWPAGQYRLEIYDGDRLGGTARFTVAAQ